MKRKMLKLFVLSIYILIGGENTDSLFIEANSLYQKGYYNQSISSYESLLNKNIDKGVLFYNIANAYYKLDQLGFARLYYEKSKLYNFNDPDVNFNLKVLEDRLIDDVLIVPDFFLKVFFKKIAYYFTSFEWSIIVLVFLYLSLVLFLILMFSLKIKTRTYSLNSLFLSMLFFLFSFVFLISIYFSNMDQYGILISDNGYVKTAPSKSSDNRFVIHEGVKFKVVDKVDDWARIELLDGNDGWIENEAFVKVFNK